MLDRSGLSVNPNLFFSTAAGPNASDIYGPPPDVLDIWANGMPVSAAQENVSNMGGGLIGCPWYMRRDMHSLLFIGVGAFMIWLHNK